MGLTCPSQDQRIQFVEEAGSQGDLAVVLMRNLAISQGLCAVDTLLLVLHVQEVWNFELWEQLRVAEVPVQDPVVKEEWDCFRGQ